MEAIQVPARTSGGRSGVRFEVLTPNRWGFGLKVAIREAAKSLPEYHLPVSLSPEVMGRTDAGVPIPVNTLGRWLFGVPGFMGQVLAEGGLEDRLVMYGPVSPPEAQRLLEKAIRSLAPEAEYQSALL